MAGGIFVDAFLIRMAVVPALMFLFGKANWWFPGWLDRILPHVSVDPELPPSGGGTDDSPDQPQAPSGPADPVGARAGAGCLR